MGVNNGSATAKETRSTSGPKTSGPPLLNASAVPWVKQLPLDVPSKPIRPSGHNGRLPKDVPKFASVTSPLAKISSKPSLAPKVSIPSK